MKQDLKKYEFDAPRILEVLKQANLVKGISLNFGQEIKNATFSNVFVDSRKVKAGGIFLAYQGVSTDGHDHIRSAIANGASLLIIESQEKVPKDLSIDWIMVGSGRGAWAYLSALFCGNPQNSLRFFGVTGTNGKTSTVWMLKELLAKEGVPCLSIGTLGTLLSDEAIESTHTTPDPDTLYRLFGLAIANGTKIAVMEVSSHSLAQEKLLPVKFEGAGFTSFSRDHLDFHKNMEDYFATKMLLFRNHLMENGCCAISTSIEKAGEIAKQVGTNALYGFTNGGSPATSIKIISSDAALTQIEIKKDGRIFTGKIPYFGSIGVENFVCAFLLAEKCLGRFPDTGLWPLLSQVPGRLQRLESKDEEPSVFIDYAHTPDALEKVLDVLRPLVEKKIIVVMGCGGNRDQGKRPIMGAIAERLADCVILTSDNPRDEDPKDIIAEIATGLLKPERVIIEIDRKLAIKKALSLAGQGDCIVVAGKGHETYQLIRGVARPFDDRAVTLGLMAEVAKKGLR
jgi:UDP-N-acetylmuramyl-tripeptide synthetase